MPNITNTKYDPMETDNESVSPFRGKQTGSVYKLRQSPQHIKVVNRVFYIDVGNINPVNIPQYMESVKATLSSGGQNNKMGLIEESKHYGVWEDFYIPVRGVIPGIPSLWSRIKYFFFGKPASVISATKIELHQIEIPLLHDYK